MTSSEVDNAIEVLKNSAASLDQRFRALFTVKTVGGRTGRSAKALADSVEKTDSVLLQHELLYNIGQFQLIKTEDGSFDFIEFLSNVVSAKTNDGIPKFHCVSRHEALESIGAIFASGYYNDAAPECVAKTCEFLKKYSDESFEPLPEVRESAYLALKRVENSPRSTSEHKIPKPSPTFDGFSQVHDYLSVDPSPAFPHEDDDVILRAYKKQENKEALSYRIQLLAQILNNTPLSLPSPNFSIDIISDLPTTISPGSSFDLWDRYRAMFSLRNINTTEAAMELCKCLSNDKTSALLRHEVAFVLGQMEKPETMEILGSSVLKEDEHPMVRHEAAEAVGAVADERGVQILTEGAKCPEAIVADSCFVAIEMLNYWAKFSKRIE